MNASVADVVRTHPELGRYSALREAIEATAIDQLEIRQEESRAALRSAFPLRVRRDSVPFHAA